MQDPAQFVVASYDAPAYVRRALQVQQAYDNLLERCTRERERSLATVRLRLGILRERAGDWSNLAPWLAGPEQLLLLQELAAIAQPRLRVRLRATRSGRVLRGSLRALVHSLERFNQYWWNFLESLDLSGVNTLRRDYNRYFLLEKECAVRSARLAQLGYRPLEPVTRAELRDRFPPLPVPQVH